MDKTRRQGVRVLPEMVSQALDQRRLGLSQPLLLRMRLPLFGALDRQLRQAAAPSAPATFPISP